MHSAYNPQRQRVAMTFTEPSLAKQSFKDECDINNIMRKYEKHGLIDHLNKHQGDYGSYLGYEDYHASLNKILEAKETFLTIPAKVRAKFYNDPALFYSFASDPANLDQMVEMGLASPAAPAAAPDPAPAVAPPAAGAPPAAPVAAPVAPEGPPSSPPPAG